MNKNFWKNKKVFITGNNGFKGGWLSLWLKNLGADVQGYSLEPNYSPYFYSATNMNRLIKTTRGDIRDYEKIKKAILKFHPDIVFHMAAQPIVRRSFSEPLETFSTNIMGTCNILHALKFSQNIKVFINITSDKCYENKEWLWGYRESDRLGGSDPYSNSKACSELITSSFKNSFYNDVAISTARAGNVIGGGDWSVDRLIPDFIRSIIEKKKLVIRNPNSIRPWQHVLSPLSGYIILAEKMFTNPNKYSGAWNFGPQICDIKNVEYVIKKISTFFDLNNFYKIQKIKSSMHEAKYLMLDSSKAISFLAWKNVLDLDKSIDMTAKWYEAYFNKNNMLDFSIAQIEKFSLLYNSKKNNDK